jgi:uncharacterized protein YegL
MKAKQKPKVKSTTKTRKTTLKPVLATLLLDETGSMLGRKTETISAFNEYVKTLQEKVKKGPGISMTLVTFNSAKRKTHFLAKPIAQVPELTQETYNPDATTPLYDAIGQTIQQAQGKNSLNGNGSDMLFIIFTDGQENASVEYSREKIFKLIDDKKKAGWSFVFLGANQDAWEAHATMGIAAAASLNYEGNIQVAMHKAAIGTVSYAAKAGQRTNSGATFFTQPDEEIS